jgi:multisubunit Na+/H+ antiporter MnhG subunit
MTTTPGLIGAIVAVVAIVCATVAVCFHVIDGAGYVGVVTGLGGAAVGAGAHASGVKQGQP